MHSRLKNISDPSKKAKDDGHAKFGLAQVLHIIFWCWFLVDDINYTEANFDKMIEEDV
jgi:hypothetical protein